MSKGENCSFFKCDKIATETCPECEIKLCWDHKSMHGHIGSISIPDDRKQSFSSLLSFYHTILKDKIRALRVLNSMSSNMIENYLASEKEKFRNKVDATLNKEEKQEYDINLSLEIISNSKYVFKNPKIAGLFAKETEMYNHREHIRRASKELVLVYLVIIFEKFLSNSLSALFMKRHEMLKESGKSILYRDALEHTDINELIKTMSKEAAKDIVESNIEDLGNKLGKRFHLYLDQRDDWTKFKQFFHRRNIIVHNYGFPDSKYIEKTKNTKFEVKGEKNEWLEISDTYINEAFSVFENYANEIADFFYQKYTF